MKINFYNQKQYIKYFLVLIGILIGSVSLYFTQKLVLTLADREHKQIYLYAKGLEYVLNYENSEASSVLFKEIIANNNSIPVILTDADENPISSKNIYIDTSLSKAKQNEFLRNHLAVMRLQHPPLKVDMKALETYNYIFYENSTLLTQLTYFPYIQLAVVGIFIFVSYFVFSTSRKAEQNSVWVGLAKETAHQLGTPLSGLMAWVEIMKLENILPEMTNEMEKDVQRLRMVTERFSSIGSIPAKKMEDVVEIVLNNIDYLRKRVSHLVSINIETYAKTNYLLLNKPLFEWVIENLVKNAVDAMEGKGTLLVVISESNNNLYIDITDSGKGILKNQFKRVFYPGFSTKQRGWGLGLTLAKRIIEEYHKGKIFVKHSEIGVGTTFRIILPIPVSKI